MQKYFLCLFFSILSITGKAQGIFDQSLRDSLTGSSDRDIVSLNGFARSFVLLAGETYDYPTAFGEMALQLKFSGIKSILFADVRGREEWRFDQNKTVFVIKEAYAAYLGSTFNLFLGNQIIAWGRTDGFNPTNNITPNDYFFLTNDPDDQKMSNFMLRSKIHFSPNIYLELLSVPFFKPSVYRYDLFDMGPGISFKDATLPEVSFKNTAFATRLNFGLPALGFSLSYFMGYSTFFGFRNESIRMIPEFSVINSAAFFRKSVAGADFELPLKNFILRSEIAWTNIENKEADLFIPYPDFSYVFGLEHDFSGYLTIIQYIGKFTPDYIDLIMPSMENPLDPLQQIKYAEEMVVYESVQMNRKIFQQQEKWNHALFLSLNKSFAYDLIRLELSAYYNLSSAEWMFRPQVNWKMTDVLTLHLGASYMFGPEMEIFDYAGKLMNGIFLGLVARF